MAQALLSRQDLAKRWGFTDTKVIQTYENNGIIKRVPGISVPRYSIIQIEELETAGLDLNPLSPIEKRRLENKIKELEEKVNYYEEKISNIKIMLS